jgi:hypothetical protein
MAVGTGGHLSHRAARRAVALVPRWQRDVQRDERRRDEAIVVLVALVDGLGLRLGLRLRPPAAEAHHVSSLFRGSVAATCRSMGRQKLQPGAIATGRLSR